ncbi:pyroglutamyl-peptidase I [Streptomyces sp. NRRL S-337]|uniref:pyroglutamyl-peptidase I n=1 Tax=Streptomyces sp. NRRL S-337 TaxID=1463900 RepID=UPI00068DEB8E
MLLTAVEPFGRNSLNSAWEACRLVADDPPPGLELEVVQLPCVFGDSIAALRKEILRADPELVVATGQGGSRPDITIERVAINLDDAQGPDNKGNQPIDSPIIPDGPAAYFSSLPVKTCTSAVLEAGIPASLSHTAGTFLCNHIAYGLAHLIATEFPHVRGGFVHVPFTPAQAADRERRPSMASATAAEALRVVLTTASTTDRDEDAETGRRGPKSWLSRLRK